MKGKRGYAVTEVISLILVFGLMTSAISIVMLWGAPYMDEKKAEARANSALTQLKSISDIIKDDVISQGTNGSSVDVKFTYENGNILFSPEGERFVICYPLIVGFDFAVTSLDLNDGDDYDITILKTSGPDPAKFFIKYLNKENQPSEEINAGDSTTYPLVDAIDITINDSSETIGKIWLFDVGSISYETACSSGTYKIILENGGVLSGKDNNGYLFNKPTIFNNSNLFVMRIIQLKPKDISSGGTGKVTYKITAELNNSYIRENKVVIPKNIKIYIYGNEEAIKAWKDYFIVNHGFKNEISGVETNYIYLNGNREFTLTHSICNCVMKVEG